MTILFVAILTLILFLFGMAFHHEMSNNDTEGCWLIAVFAILISFLLVMGSCTGYFCNDIKVLNKRIEDIKELKQKQLEKLKDELK
jgi:glycerol uptake facilitator-like aquaporin